MPREFREQKAIGARERTLQFIGEGVKKPNPKKECRPYSGDVKHSYGRKPAGTLSEHFQTKRRDEALTELDDHRLGGLKVCMAITEDYSIRRLRGSEYHAGFSVKFVGARGFDLLTFLVETSNAADGITFALETSWKKNDGGPMGFRSNCA